MIRKIYRIPLLVIFIFCSHALYGKNDSVPSKPFIQLIAKPTKTSVMLRWAPTTPVAWSYLNKYGYRIDRYTVMKDNKFISNSTKTVLTPKPIKPWEISRWEKMIDTSDAAAVVAQAIYGESFEVSGGNQSELAKIINKSKDLDARYSFAVFSANQSIVVAAASALFFNDTTAKINEYYLYRIISLVPDTIEKIDSGFVYVGIKDYIPLPRPRMRSVDIKDKYALITWDRIHFDDVFNNYIVERSDDSCKSFNRITRLPYVNLYNNIDNNAQYYVNTDTVPLTGRLYSYRVKGVTMFGEVSEASDTITTLSVKFLKCRPTILNAEIEDGNKVHLIWELTGSEFNSVKGFNILRSNNANKNFSKINKEILSSENRNFTHINPKTTNYYKIVAIGDNGEETESFPYMVQLEDSVPPSSPKGLTGIIDSIGNVILKWRANSEEDIKGYLVYRANYKNEEFTQITSEFTGDTTFIDSINIKTLTRNIYYKLVAIDTRFNQSAFSSVLVLSRPDIIPPQKPVFRSYKINSDSISISWIKSYSNDVVKHVLYRRFDDESQWKIIKSINEPDTTCTYTDVPEGNSRIVEYTIIAVDSAKLESEPMKSLKIKLPPRQKPAITKLTVKAEFSPRNAHLNWNYSKNEVVIYTIYKSEEGKPLVTYRSVNGQENSFLDSQVELGKKYSYCIKAIYSDGSESPLSKIIVVSF